MNDRLRESLLAIIDAATRRTKYHQRVRARVVQVLGDGRVETVSETPGTGTPPLPALPLRYGLPGVLRAVVRTGARCVVAWAEGDPAQPYVAAWDASELAELVFDVSGGAKRLARDDDTVDCGVIRVTAVNVPGGGGAALALVYTPPTGGGTPTTVTIGFTAPTAFAPEIQPPGTAIALVGKVAGTSDVKA